VEIGFAGIHHVTAIAGDPQANVDFYSGLLGLRLVKKTVNFDDPTTYHLYYGDATGKPGTIMTFFTWPGAVSGRVGAGQVSATRFAVPEGSLGFWTERLVGHGVRFGQPERRFDETVLSFSDDDGLPVEIAARPGLSGPGEPWPQSTVPPEHAPRLISGVTLSERSREVTADLLTGFLGFEKVGEEGGRARYAAGESFADVLEASAPGAQAVGTVHHVAWRAPNEETQKAWREEIEARGFNVTPVLDRKYFRSIYFREPGGVLFEIATDAPGFPVDEPVEELGSHLKLPPWLEDRRADIEASLPPIRPPRQGG
jgi:glyoxalase family protein